MRRPEGLQALSLALAALGAACLARSGWIHVKAALAQRLIAHTWAHARDHVSTAARRDGAAAALLPAPWPGADFRPVARLTVAAGKPLYVLEGASARSLAFGPVHDAASVLPGEPGNSLIEGHRDTHFAVLRSVQPGARLTVERLDGSVREFRVTERRIIDARRTRLVLDGDAPQLVLATCWPFDARLPGGPMRLLVLAQAVPASEPLRAAADVSAQRMPALP